MENNKPKNLQECFEFLNDIVKNKSLFKDSLEGNAIAMSHHFLGRNLRNDWRLWWSPELAKSVLEKNPESDYPQERPELVRYFNEELNIDHADDMSGIIITSYHRHLNGRDLDLPTQVKKYHDHWAKYGK